MNAFPRPGQGLITFLTDFGRRDGTVSQMYGVVLGVDPTLNIQEITHETAPFAIEEASYRLFQTTHSWPAGTVFVAVIDPGVGSSRRSVVVHTKQDHYIVTPDNGTLTHIKEHFGLREAREIDETVNRRQNSEDSQTFHGRDVYGYTGARLAAGIIDFAGVGPSLDPETLITLPRKKPRVTEGQIEGIIEIHDIIFGNIWTNIPLSLLREAGMRPGDRVQVSIQNQENEIYKKTLLYGPSFFSVPTGGELLYNNEISYAALGMNQGDFAATHRIGYGSDWIIRLKKRTSTEKGEKDE